MDVFSTACRAPSFVAASETAVCAYVSNTYSLDGMKNSSGAQITTGGHQHLSSGGVRLNQARSEPLLFALAMNV